MKIFRKIIPFLLILVMLVGFLSPLSKVQAQSTPPPPPPDQIGICGPPDPLSKVRVALTQSECASQYPGWPWTGISGNQAVTTPGQPKSGLEEVVDQYACNILRGEIMGCVLQYIIYPLFVTIPSFLMAYAANLFDFFAIMTLSSTIYNLDFVGKIWTIVRDFANIFFILVLLYAAIQIILDLGHGGGRKTVGMVILVALLVNFSLFFTKVVIDSSNIAALIFYNRIDTTHVNYVPTSTLGEKDMAGALISTFEINNFFGGGLFDKLNKSPEVQASGGNITNSPYILMALMIIYGVIVFALTYAFFVVAMTLLSRMLTLILLMIISPFAFVSATLPGVDMGSLSFKKWVHKLMQVAFMAVIFMFIIYLIAEILNAHIFDQVADTTNLGILATLVILFVPALLIVILLLKGVKFAKESSGDFSAALAGGAQKVFGLVTGAAIGVATGGAALAGRVAVGGAGAMGRATIGRVAQKYADDPKVKKIMAETFGGEFLMSGLKKAGSASFDVRNTTAGKMFQRNTGLDLGKGKEGGYAEQRQKDVEKRLKRAKDLEVGEDEKLKQDLNNVERDHQDLLRSYSGDIEQIDKKIESARTNASDLGRVASSDPTGMTTHPVTGAAITNKDAHTYAEDQLKFWKKQKTELKKGNVYSDANGTLKAGGKINGNSIDDFESKIIPDAHHAIEIENNRRRWKYAQKLEDEGNLFVNRFLSLGVYSKKGALESAQKVRMGAKLDSGSKH